MTSSLYVITVVMDDELGFLNTRSSLLSQNDQDFHWIVVDSSKNPIKGILRVCRYGEDKKRLRMDVAKRNL